MVNLCGLGLFEEFQLYGGQFDHLLIWGNLSGLSSAWAVWQLDLEALGGTGIK